MVNYNLIEHLKNNLILNVGQRGKIDTYPILRSNLSEIEDGSLIVFDKSISAFRIVPTEAASQDLFSEEKPIPVTIGGIAAGTVYMDATVAQILHDLLYPYQWPAFSGSLTPASIEVGAESGYVTINFTITNQDNVVSSANIYVDGELIGIDASSPYQLDSMQLTEVGQKDVLLEGVNTKGTKFTKNLTIKWLPRVWYGEESAETLDEAGIKGLRVSLLTDTYKRTISYLAGGYKWYCIPAYMGTPTFKDTATGMNVAMEEPYTVQITNDHKVTLDYRCYRSTNVLNGSIQIAVS